MSQPISQAVACIVLAMYKHSGSIRNAAETAGCSFSAARRVIRAAGVEAAKDAPADENPEGAAKFVREESGNTAEVRFSSRKPIRTEKEAIAHAELDMTTWVVVSCKITSGEVAMKVGTRDKAGKILDEKPHTEPVWWITLKLQRIMPKAERDSLELLFRRLEKVRSPLPAVRIRRPSDPHLMVVGLHDTHFGKLAWAPETGQNYDLRIADLVYRDAVEDLLSRASSYDVDEFLVPIGSDFLHIDNAGGTTTAGTPQDVDGRIAKILDVAEAATVYGVEAMASRGRVVLQLVGGNHDRLLSLCLARTIKAYFRHNSRVTVDVAPTRRKYHKYHSVLIGTTHGDGVKLSELPLIMAQECREWWAQTTCREIHTGHLHKPKKTEHLSLDTYNGIPVRTLPSLSAVDAWHYGAGFVGTQRAAEGYVYSRSGLAGYFVADVRRELATAAA